MLIVHEEGATFSQDCVIVSQYESSVFLCSWSSMQSKTQSAGRKLCLRTENGYSIERLGNLFFLSAQSVATTFTFLFARSMSH